MSGNTAAGKFGNWLGDQWNNITNPTSMNSPGAQVLGNASNISGGPGVLNEIQNAPPPTQPPPQPVAADATTTAIQNQLSQEKIAASTSAFLTTGQGLLDEPTTTSRVLLGN